MNRIHETFSRSIHMRGQVLDSMIDVERLIDDLLSFYFTSDDIKENELKEMLWHTERINLGSKKEILFLILNSHYKRWLNQNPNFITSLQEIIPHRNIFAHLELDLSKEYATNEPIELIFKKYKSGKLKLEIYPDDRLTELMDKFTYLKMCLITLITIIKPPLA